MGWTCHCLAFNITYNSDWFCLNTSVCVLIIFFCYQIIKSFNSEKDKTERKCTLGSFWLIWVNVRGKSKFTRTWGLNFVDSKCEIIIINIKQMLLFTMQGMLFRAQLIPAIATNIRLQWTMMIPQYTTSYLKIYNRNRTKYLYVASNRFHRLTIS